MLHGAGFEVGISLVRHPRAEAVGFTGSLKGGRALFDQAASRPRPIPVYAEMGSINPVFVLPSALEKNAEEVAQALFQSMTLGAGQFCTNPGLVVGLKGESLDEFLKTISTLTSGCAPATMLHAGIRQAYIAGIQDLSQTDGVGLISQAGLEPDSVKTEVRAAVLTTDAKTFVGNANLSNEVFGPSTLVVVCETGQEMETIARHLEGHLTATLQCTADDLMRHQTLISILENKVGRTDFQWSTDGSGSLFFDAPRWSLSGNHRCTHDISGYQLN